MWTTEKDGIAAALLAAEMTARVGRDPGEVHRDLSRELGTAHYARKEAPATPAEKAVLKRLSAEQVRLPELAGEPVQRVLTHAPGNGAAIEGVKVETENAWFAARPSGTEDIYKIYAESFRGPDHLRLDMHWSWNHCTDRIWRGLDGEVWERTHNPWIVLQRSRATLCGSDFPTLRSGQRSTHSRTRTPKSSLRRHAFNTRTPAQSSAASRSSAWSSC